MLFFTRCFLCIGAVVVLAEGAKLTEPLHNPKRWLEPAQREAAARIEGFCRAAPQRCVAAASAALGTAPDRDFDMSQREGAHTVPRPPRAGSKSKLSRFEFEGASP